jgi:hypothetical protein
MGVVAEQDDKETAQKDKPGGSRRVGDLQLVAAGDELTAVPEAAGSFHGHYIYCCGDDSDDPSDDVVDFGETHGGICSIWARIKAKYGNFPRIGFVFLLKNCYSANRGLIGAVEGSYSK